MLRLCHAVPCNALPLRCSAMPCFAFAMLRFAPQRSAFTTPYSALQSKAQHGKGDAMQNPIYIPR